MFKPIQTGAKRAGKSRNLRFLVGFGAKPQSFPIYKMAKKSRYKKKRNPVIALLDGLLTLLDRLLEGFAAGVVALLKGVGQLLLLLLKGVGMLLLLLIKGIFYPFGRLWRLLVGRRNRAARCMRLTGFEFEEYMAQVLKDNGFRHVEVTVECGDQGVDILAVRNGRTYAIQCKNYTDLVGNKAVQEAYAGAQYYGCDIPVVVCPTDFTIPAQELAESTGVELWNGEKLSHMMRVSGRRPHHDPKRDDEY